MCQECFVRILAFVLITALFLVVVLGADEVIYDEQGRWKGGKGLSPIIEPMELAKKGKARFIPEACFFFRYL